MEATMETHEYGAELTWTGSTAAGYRGYDRAHRVRTPPAAQELEMTADPAFLGDASLLNPEQLLTAAASSCQLLSFLALAARARLDVVSYVCSAVARLPMATGRIETIVLKATITVRAPADKAAIVAMMHEAHETCFIARSLNTDVQVEAEVEIVGSDR
jgi:organic hydroperoxide reductase OsmC/OhrA